jgi:hypothetical protein
MESDLQTTSIVPESGPGHLAEFPDECGPILYDQPLCARDEEDVPVSDGQ